MRVDKFLLELQQLFENQGEMFKWLLAKNPAFKDRTPIELINSQHLDELENMMDQIAEGVAS